MGIYGKPGGSILVSEGGSISVSVKGLRVLCVLKFHGFEYQQTLMRADISGY